MRALNRVSTVSISILLVVIGYGVFGEVSSNQSAKHPETSTHSKSELSEDLFPSSIGARNAAIEAARAAGQRTYHYRTGFTPGLGIVGGASN